VIARELRDWSLISVSVRRQVAGGGRNSFSTEVLASNYVDIPARLATVKADRPLRPGSKKEKVGLQGAERG